jgi:hypothetical protein
MQVVEALLHPSGQSMVARQADASEAHVSIDLPSALQRLLPDRHTPVQSPEPVQTNSQSRFKSQVPIALQASDRLPLQRFAPGMHEPLQLPLEQRLVQAEPAGCH